MKLHSFCHATFAVSALLTMSPCSVASAAPLTDWAGHAFGAATRSPSVGSRVSTDDLLRLRKMDGFALSPDGSQIAFRVYQAVPESNAYVVRWFVVSTDGSAQPRPFALDGGQPIPAYAYGLPHAYIPAETAAWSPDGAHLAVRRLNDDRIELWVIDVRSGRSARASNGGADVIKFRWRSDGALIYRTGFNATEWKRAVSDEARHGWLWDSRFTLVAGKIEPTRPDCEQAAAPTCENVAYVVEPGEGVRQASPEETAWLDPNGDRDDADVLAAARPDGVEAVARAIAPSTVDPPIRCARSPSLVAPRETAPRPPVSAAISVRSGGRDGGTQCGSSNGRADRDHRTALQAT